MIGEVFNELRGQSGRIFVAKIFTEAVCVMFQTTLVWFRYDLRAFDHTALQEAVRLGLPVVGMYVFEPEGAPVSEGRRRRRVFVHQCLSELQSRLAEKGVPLFVAIGSAEREVPAFAKDVDAAYVVCAGAGEPDAVHQENVVAAHLVGDGRQFKVVNDDAVLSKFVSADSEGKLYTDFDAYRKAWLAASAGMVWQPSDDWAALTGLQTGLSEHLRFAPELPSLKQLGMEDGASVFEGGERAADKLLAGLMRRMGDYHLGRGLSAQSDNFRLSPYLRFGVISVRYLIGLIKRMGGEGEEVLLNALMRREFYHRLVYRYPNVLLQGFNPKYRNIAWENNPQYLVAWQEGRTGYPLLDAAMRCLNQTGYLPDSLRSYAAAFLSQVLLCDWRLGEAYFAGQLLDFDLAVNNGCWQDAVGVGACAQKPLSMMHPVFAAQKLDPVGQTIRRYVPELAHVPKDVIHTPWLGKASINTNGYPDPVAEYSSQRKKALVLYDGVAD